MSGIDDLQTLLANLKPHSPPSAAANGQLNQHPSKPASDPKTFFQSQASPALASAPAIGSSKLPNSSMTSPTQTAGTAGTGGGNDRTQSLLSLLKFSQPSLAGPTTQQPSSFARSASENNTMRQETAHGKSVTASDLMSSFLSPQNTPETRRGPNTLPYPSTASGYVQDMKAPKAGNTAQESSQDALLKLLKRSASSGNQRQPAETPKAQHSYFPLGGPPNADIAGASTESQRVQAGHEDSQARKPSPIRTFGSGQSSESTPFEPPSTTVAKENNPIFTYTNPFEMLQASRNTTPQLAGPGSGKSALTNVSNDLPSNEDERGPIQASAKQASMRRILTPKGPLKSSSSTQPLIEKESVTKQLDTIAIQANKKVERALESADIKKEDEGTEAEMDAVAGKLEETVIDAAVNLKKELDKEDNQGVLEEAISKPVADAVKDSVNDAAGEALPAGSWESSDEPLDPAPRDVPVYSFPLKPFISITIMNLPPSKVGLREDGVMEISRFKKEFDQLDRTLASATSKYITYAFVKNGGMRVIRQDDGSDRQVFKNSGDRIFHVALCTTATTAPPTDEQGVLGIGLSGTVYYATISRDGNDLFEDDGLDTESLIFPPHPPGDENSSGGVLKTRVRRSSRHPEFFAIGRGKSIHLVWPATALSTKYGISGSARTVDVEKLYQDRSLKITNGKAGKDFVFSEDDTLIASLDKAGKLRFWDIRKLVNESNATASKVQGKDIDIPILSLATSSPAEKSWPTSVLFLDKVRPYTKGTALRYILVGLKQNHTLQLWDIALGKAVQELNFPHDTETDGICSVAYHPNSGILVVGHPTRNSIFFLHLSAPRYTLQPMSQASYLERIAIRDPDLAKPEATACVSGMRELSFTSKGHLRSIDLLSVHKHADAPKEPLDAQILFELYAVHSRGVTCVAIKKEDLGWGPDSKVLHAVDNALDTGLLKMEELKHVGPVEDADVNGAADTPQPSKAHKRKPTKGITEPPPAAASAKEKLERFPPAPSTAADADLPNGVRNGEVNASSTGTAPDKDKKKKKKSGTSSTLAPPAAKGPEPSGSPPHPLLPSKTSPTATDLTNQTATPNVIDAMASDQPPRSPWTPASSGGTKDNVGMDISGNWLDREVKKLESSVSTEFNKGLDKLYRRLDDDRHVQDAASTSRQEAVLRLVSSSLSTNVENTLNRIIGQHMQQVVLPAVTNATAQAIHNQVGEALARILHGLIPHEIGTQLPVAISTAMQNPTHIRSLTENISKRLTPSVEAHFGELMRSTISPTFQRLAVSAAEKVTGEIESRIEARFQQYEVDRKNDAAKIDKLQGSMQSMLDMMAHVTEGQIAFQEQILKDRSSLTQLAGTGSRPSSSAATAFRPVALPTRQVSSAQRSPIAPPPKQISPEELEVEEIGRLMDESKFEEASVKWLQSGQSVGLFDKLFINYTPDYLQTAVSPLVAFSVGITVANAFEQNVYARLDWIYTSLNTVDTKDPEMMSLSEHGPALLGSLIAKLEQLYRLNAGRGRGDPLMQMITQVIMKAKDVKSQFDQ